MATKPGATEYAAEAMGRDDRPVIAGLNVTKVTHEYVPIYGGGKGTMGQMVDEHLRMCALDGSEVQSVELRFHDEEWPAYAAMLREPR